MTAYPAWTPAPRPGIVPLHPYGFGTTLGRSFTALRQNPAVLLGFALCVQALAYIVVLAAVGGVAIASLTRLDTLVPGSDDWNAVMAGSLALTIVVGVLLGIASGALGVIVQGIVVTEVAHAVVAEKLTLRALWRRVRPAAWRLIGYAFLVATAAVLGLAILGGLLFLLGTVALPLAIVLGILVVVGLIPLTLWLTTKLLLVPAVIILERAPMWTAVARSWRLTRRRFWPTLGVTVIISVTFSTIAQIVGVPLQFVAMGASTLFAPTGDPEVGAIIALLVTAILTQIVTILVQCVAVIVQSTATALIYVDCRMRHEGLDLDLLGYVERRDAGATDLADPYLAGIGRTPAPRPAYGYPAPPPPAYAGYPAPGATPGYAAPAPAPTGPWGPPAPGAPRPGPSALPAPGAPVAGPPAPPAAPDSTRWAAPGAEPS